MTKTVVPKFVACQLEDFLFHFFKNTHTHTHHYQKSVSCSLLANDISTHPGMIGPRRDLSVTSVDRQICRTNHRPACALDIFQPIISASNCQLVYVRRIFFLYSRPFSCPTFCPNILTKQTL